MAVLACVGLALSAGYQAAEQSASDTGAGGSLNTSAIPAAEQYLVPYLEEAGSLCPSITAPLLAAQIDQESGWDPAAVSPAGAEGISQFLPSTWTSWSQPPATAGPDTPFDAPDAVLAQGRFMCALAGQMAPLARQTGIDVVSLALAAYNAGSAAVVAAQGIPQNGQTPQYVQRILAAEATYTATTLVSDSTFGLAMVKAAESQLGVPYSWGGGTFTGPSLGVAQGAGTVGFDCSGLVLFAAYQASGGALRLPHSSEQQATLGRPVPKADLQPGDVIAFALGGGTDFDHIGVYIGNDEMIDAPDTGSAVRVDELNSYWQSVPWAIRSYAPAPTVTAAAVTPRTPSGPYEALSPGADVAGAVAAAPAGTSFLLADGDYHTGGIVPKDGDEIVGQDRDGVVLEGDGRPDAFTGSTSNVLLADLTVSGYSPGRLHAAVDGQDGTNWTFLNLHVTGNMEEGLAVGPGSLVDGSLLDYNGNVGLGTGTANNDPTDQPFPDLKFVVEDTTMDANGAQDPTDAGGAKVLFSSGAIFSHDTADGNQGFGIWADGWTTGTVVEDSTVQGNRFGGVFIEISSEAQISGVVATDNALGFCVGNSPISCGAAGVAISDSHDVSVTGSTIENDGPGGKILVAVYNGHQSTSLLYNVQVHGNTLGPGFAGVFTDPPDPQAAATSSFSGNS